MYYSGDKGEGGKRKEKKRKTKKRKTKKRQKDIALHRVICVLHCCSSFGEGEGEKEYVQNALDQISIIQKEKNQKEPYHLNRDRRAGA